MTFCFSSRVIPAGKGKQGGTASGNQEDDQILFGEMTQHPDDFPGALPVPCRPGAGCPASWRWMRFNFRPWPYLTLISPAVIRGPRIFSRLVAMAAEAFPVRPRKSARSWEEDISSFRPGEILMQGKVDGENLLGVHGPKGLKKNFLGIPPQGTGLFHRDLPFALSGSLFHGHALGQVSRLVHIRPFENGDIIGQKLQGDVEKDGREQMMGLRKTRDILGLGGHLLACPDWPGQSLSRPGPALLRCCSESSHRSCPWAPGPRPAFPRRSGRSGRASSPRPDILRRECTRFPSASAPLPGRWGN